MEKFSFAELAAEARLECEKRREVWAGKMYPSRLRRLEMMERIAELLQQWADLEPEEPAAAVQPDFFGGE